MKKQRTAQIIKSELILRIAKRFPQLVANDTEVAVRAILKGIFDALTQGRHIEIRGFGSFNLIYRKPRVGRNPRSGVKILVSAKYAPHFKVGLDLKLRLAENKKRLSILKSDN